MDKFLKILGIINTIPTIIATIEQTHSRLAGRDKSKVVEQQVMAALEASALVKVRIVTDEKRFGKSLRKTVDGIVGMFNASVWKGQ